MEYADKVFIEPTKIPPNLTLSTSLENPRANGLWTTFYAKVSVINKSQRNAHVLQTWFNLYGYRLPSTASQSPTSDYAQDVKNHVEDERAAEDTVVSRYFHDTFGNAEATAIYSGKLMERQPWFQSSQEFSTTQVFSVQSNSWDVLRYRIDVTFALDDRYLCEDWATGSRGELWGDAYQNVVGPRPVDLFHLTEIFRPTYEVRSCSEQRDIRNAEQQDPTTWPAYWRVDNSTSYERFGLTHDYSTSELSVTRAST